MIWPLPLHLPLSITTVKRLASSVLMILLDLHFMALEYEGEQWLQEADWNRRRQSRANHTSICWNLYYSWYLQGWRQVIKEQQMRIHSKWFIHLASGEMEDTVLVEKLKILTLSHLILFQWDVRVDKRWEVAVCWSLCSSLTGDCLSLGGLYI